MTHHNIFKTPAVASVLPQKMLENLIDFLVTHRQYILPLSKKNDAFKSRLVGNGPIVDIVHRLTTLGKDQTYSLIRFPSKTTTLREVVDMTFVPFDLLQIKEAIPHTAKILDVIPELNDKIVINISDITKSDGTFSDITQFHWRIVRDFLSRSFYTNTGNIWITPALVRYVAKVYSMTIGGQIARLFGLSSLMQMFVQTLFCLYFSGRMTKPELAQSFVKTNSKALGLQDPQDLNQIFAFVEDVLGKDAPETLEEIFTVIDMYNHDQLKINGVSRLTRPVLNVKFSSLFPEGHVSTIALEYPPYFLFLILLVLSNTRIGLSIHMKNLNLIREGQDVMTQLLKSPVLTHGI